MAGPHSSVSQEVKEAFAQGARDFYAWIDWALDVSDADFDGVELPWVPGDLVRRDPQTQFLLRRQSLNGIDTAELSSGRRFYFRRFEQMPFDSIVIVAPRHSKYFDDILAELTDLRARGLAE